MRIEYLQIFVDLAETLNFTRTSENMSISQSAVSQLIKSLENELGMTLFDRDKRSVSLTASGFAFYEDLKPIVLKYSLAVERASKIDARNRRALTIGYTGTLFEITHFPLIISKFNSKYPDIQIYLMNLNHNQLKKSLVSRYCDLIFQTQDSVEHIPEVTFQTLLNGQFICLVPEKHDLRNQAKITFNDLDGETVILLNDSISPPKQHRVQKNIKESCNNSIFCYSDSIVISHTMVQGGVGLTVIPDLTTNNFDNSKNEGFVIRDFEYDEKISYGIAYLEKYLNSIQKEFISCAEEIIGNRSGDAIEK